jgi:hypothetical protein
MSPRGDIRFMKYFDQVYKIITENDIKVKSMLGNLACFVCLFCLFRVLTPGSTAF